MEDILANKIVHCDAVHKACLRFKEDLQKQGKKDFPYIFNEKRADMIIEFIETLKFSEQDFLDKNFILDDWQSFIIANIFGWVHKQGNRRFKKAFIFVGRGNGKSPLASAIALANMIMESAGQVYAISTNYTQSAIIYNYMKNFINKDETLQQIFKIYAHSIENTIKASYFRPLSSKFRGFDGFNPSFVIADEVAAMSDYSLLNVFTTALHKRKNSFLLMITTANYTNDSAPGVVEYNYSKNILNAIIKDEEYFTIIFEADKHDNPSDKTCYKKANPASFVDTEKLYKLFIESKNKKQMYDSFLTKNLNIFVLGATNEFVDFKKINKIKENYEKYKDEITEEILQNSYCSVGADFSNRRDLTSITFSFYVEKLNKVYQEHFIFTTQYERPDTIANLYNLFIKQGHLFMCEGEYIDREFILRVILTNIKKYKLQKEKVYFYYDEFGAIDYVTILDNFVTCVPVRQNLISISEHTKNFEELINDEMIFSNNDVFLWCLQNARKYESNNLIKIQKENKDSELKIDAAISSLLSAIGIKQYLNTIQKNNIIGNITTDNLINVYKSLYKL